MDIDLAGIKEHHSFGAVSVKLNGRASFKPWAFRVTVWVVYMGSDFQTEEYGK